MSFKQNKNVIAILIAIALATLGTLPPILTAAPDSPPDTQVEFTLPAEGLCNPSFTTGIQNFVTDGSSIYTYETCFKQGSTTQRIITIRKFTTAGSLVWSTVRGCSATSCVTGGIAFDPAGFIGIYYVDPGTASAAKQQFEILNSNGGSVCSRSGSYFTLNIIGQDNGDTIGADRASTLLGVKNPTNATIVYVMTGAGGSAAVSFTSANTTGCHVLWEQNTWTGSGGVSWDPTNKVGYSSQSSANVVRFNVTTGTALQTTNFGADVARFRVWTNSTHGSLWGTKEENIGAAGITMNEHNATGTMTGLRSYNPVEARVFVSGSLRNTKMTQGGGDVFLDGADNYFATSNYNLGGAQIFPYIAKFNITAGSGQRWNLTGVFTVSGTNDASGVMVTCGTGGTLMFSWVENLPGPPAHQKSRIRVFNGGCTPRASDASVTIPTGITPTTTPPNGDALTGLKNFANDTGFITSGSKILWGFFLMIILTITAGAIGFRVAGRETALIAAGATAFVISIINVVAEWWPVWITVMFAVGIAAFVSYKSRKLFAGG